VGLHEAYHLGMVVRDLEGSMERYSALLGVEGWNVQDATNQAIFRGRELTMRNRIAFARWGLKYLELVEPVEGDSPATEYLQRRGEGPYHVGYTVDDLEADIPLGAEVCNTVWHEGIAVARYLDTLDSLGLFIQLSPLAVLEIVESGLPAPSRIVI
jgi:methylmalonyl-CoA/ethylmalonyl-CoA epimerase